MNIISEIRPGLGLSSAEVSKNRETFGFNEITGKKSHETLKLFLRQFKNFMVYVLILAALVSLLAGETTNVFVIAIIILFIGILGFVQEYKAKTALEELKKTLNPTTLVIRDGKQEEIASRELVPGDIILLRMGDIVPADCVVLEEACLKANEAALTGESRPVKKEAVSRSLLEMEKYKFTMEQFKKKENRLFTGTQIVEGRCKAAVLFIGARTEFGKIASELQEKDELIPLQIEVNNLMKTLVKIVSAICLALFAFILFTQPINSSSVIVGSLVLVIALAVSAFPEGFPAVLTIALAVGVQRMAKKNAIVNKLPAVETLGSVTVICCDKTGTITKNEMTVEKLYVPFRNIEVSGAGYNGNGAFFDSSSGGAEISPLASPQIRMLLRTAVLCNDSEIQDAGKGLEYKIIGSLTEGALLVMASKAKLFREELESKFARIEEIPFNSERKMMSTLNRSGNGFVIHSKGALNKLLPKCTHCFDGKKVARLTNKIRQGILAKNEEFGRQGLRVIAFAYRKTGARRKFGLPKSESNLVFLGLAGMSDPPKEGVKESIAECRKAGIKVVMVTGDDKNTAISIAEKIGLLERNSIVMTGDELDRLSKPKLERIICEVAIFARVSPFHKLRIIDAYKAKGEIIAMTGDGINDAPALESAHIGVAMGISGTGVSRKAADIVLKDDNFSTIVSAIREGRLIYSNIRKFVTYQLSCNFAEVFIVVLGVILFGPAMVPLLALQILFMNLVTDDLPAITLSLDMSDSDMLKETPKDPKEPLIVKKFASLIFFSGIVMGIGTLMAFASSIPWGIDRARSIALVTLIGFELFNAVNFHSLTESVFKSDYMSNKWLTYAITASIALTALIIYVPFLNSVFGTTPLNVIDWAMGLGVSASVVVAMEFLKETNRMRLRRQAAASGS